MDLRTGMAVVSYRANNKEYERARNRLIPIAEKYANKLHGRNGWAQVPAEYAEKWNKAFHRKMNKLAKERIYAHV